MASIISSGLPNETSLVSSKTEEAKNQRDLQRMRQFITKNSANIEMCESMCKPFIILVQNIINEHSGGNPSFRLSIHLEQVCTDIHLSCYALKKRSKFSKNVGSGTLSEEMILPFRELHFWANLLTKRIRETLKSRKTFVVKQRMNQEDYSFWIEITVNLEVYDKLRSEMTQ